ncbi:unnamed protein product [Orchesella dallaii]|uniref:Uncharacterized protein n=1 Tax=Orchesella dallaii TaxID=48710 RepID=A0ABP1PW55_9HEXA
MALPTARRPKEVEEELQAELEAKQREFLKFPLDPKKLFMETMKTWYTELSQKEKSCLTRRKLKRKAVAYCYPRKMVYDRLPLDWVKRLQMECGLKFYEKPKRKPNPVAENKFQNQTSLIDACPSSPSSASSDSSMFRTVCDSKVKSQTADDVDRLIKQAQKSKVKKFMDLSSEPPPPQWLKAYADGMVLPRVLRTFSTEDTNILFWDYAPNLQDRDGKVVNMVPLPRINLLDIKDLNKKPTFYEHLKHFVADK